MITTRYKRFALFSALVAAFVVPVAAEAHPVDHLTKYEARQQVRTLLNDPEYFEYGPVHSLVTYCVRIRHNKMRCGASFADIDGDYWAATVAVREYRWYYEAWFVRGPNFRGDTP